MDSFSPLQYHSIDTGVVSRKRKPPSLDGEDKTRLILWQMRDRIEI